MSEREIINTHDQLVRAGGGYAIVRRVGPGSNRQSGWAIYLVNATGEPVATDPNGPWYNYKRLVFNQGTKRESLAKAQAWVAQKTGTQTKWSCNEMRDYVPADINKRFPCRKLKRTVEDE